jgi:hypothetical protein
MAFTYFYEISTLLPVDADDMVDVEAQMAILMHNLNSHLESSKFGYVLRAVLDEDASPLFEAPHVKTVFPIEIRSKLSSMLPQLMNQVDRIDPESGE